jgi:NTE family protein
MLFHVGALWRLNEAGLLGNITRVSSVSGGSITAGVLALAWKELAFASGTSAKFVPLIVEPIRRLARETLDKGAIITGVLGPGTVADRVAKKYAKHLFGEATLQDLPDAPRFIFNATNLQTGSLWRFSKRHMGDYRVGLVYEPKLPLARAVAASSAFPPVLSPIVLDLGGLTLKEEKGTDLHREPFTSRAVLSDGGVYDNLGLETVWKRCRTVYVSDGGGRVAPEEDPAHFWPKQSIRVLNVIDRQVRSLRKRQLIESYMLGRTTPTAAAARKGCYWGIWTGLDEYKCPEPLLTAPRELTDRVAGTPTRLAALEEDAQERLINWGYAACDASLRGWKCAPNGAPAPAYPYHRGVT